VLAFVGRTEPLARLTAAYQALAAPGGTVSGWAGLVLVIGEAGIGKTTLLTRFASRVRADGGTVVCGVRAGTVTRRRRGGRGPRHCGDFLIETPR
jgi:predicted ATP-dependent serine protease